MDLKIQPLLPGSYELRYVSIGHSDGSRDSRKGAAGGKSGCFPSLASCMHEKQFHIKIAKERKGVCVTSMA